MQTIFVNIKKKSGFSHQFSIFQEQLRTLTSVLNSQLSSQAIPALICLICLEVRHLNSCQGSQCSPQPCPASSGGRSSQPRQVPCRPPSSAGSSWGSGWASPEPFTRLVNENGILPTTIITATYKTSLPPVGLRLRAVG